MWRRGFSAAPAAVEQRMKWPELSISEGCRGVGKPASTTPFFIFVFCSGNGPGSHWTSTSKTNRTKSETENLGRSHVVVSGSKSNKVTRQRQSQHLDLDRKSVV